MNECHVTKHVNFVIPVYLHKEFKQLALNKDEKIGKLFNKVIMEYVEKEKSKNK
ncbi:MAG: hypothetical protein QG610_432 [Euryarchaeota archaeon]|nr:hypothetical protein [Euryarchaeota archaeon]